MNDGPSLGFSTLPQSGYSAGKFYKLRRAAYVLVALLVVGTVFYYLTRAVQTSTAHATSNDSPLHSDQ